MKAFIAVSLVCYLGVASAGLTLKLPAINLEMSPAECRGQAFGKVIECAKIGFTNGTALVECLVAVIVNYLECTADCEPQLEKELLPLADTDELRVNKFKCIANNILDTLKCIVNDKQSLSWAGIIKCIVTNVPGLLPCFPQ